MVYNIYSITNGTPTKRHVTKRQVAKRPVSKRPVSKRQVYKTSGLHVRLQTVRFQNVKFQNVHRDKSFKTSSFFYLIYYFLNKKYRNCQVCIPIQSKECVIFYLLLAIIVIYGKKPSKIQNKTQPSLCLQTWLQQNLRISTNHKYLQNL